MATLGLYKPNKELSDVTIIIYSSDSGCIVVTTHVYCTLNIITAAPFLMSVLLVDSHAVLLLLHNGAI